MKKRITPPTCATLILATLALIFAAEPGPAADTDAALKTETSSDSSNTDSDSTEASTTPESPQSSDGLLTPRLVDLRDKVGIVIDRYRVRHLNTLEHSPWEVMHAIVAFGVDTQIRQGGRSGEPVTAIGWLCFNGRCRGQNLFYRSSTGFGVQNGPGVQGHDGQLLAILAQSRLKEDYPIKINGRDFTIADLIEYEKKTCQPGTELTFKLIGLMHYLESDAKWESQYGQQWSIPRLIREEIAQPIRGATCGGSHRLFGLSYAIQKRALRGEPITGEFRRAEKYINDYHAYTLQLQNSDGSFSSNWFSGRGDHGGASRKLYTTGHTLEWLAFSLPKEELTRPEITKAVEFLADLLSERSAWEIGPLGHALHALTLYQERAFADPSAGATNNVAQD